MARFAIIDAGRVTNIIEADAEFAASIGAIDATGGSIGDLWDGVAFTKPLPDLATAKTEKNARINQWRAAANQTSFPHGGKLVACDALSRSDIDAVANSIALTGAFPAGFPGAWKAIDNSYIMLPNVDAFKAMHASMTAQGTINFGHSQDLKMALAAATTVEQVNAITWA